MITRKLLEDLGFKNIFECFLCCLYQKDCIVIIYTSTFVVVSKDKDKEIKSFSLNEEFEFLSYIRKYLV